MPRAKKDGRRINYFIDREVFEDTELFAAVQRYPVTTAIEILLEKGLEAAAREAGFSSRNEWASHLKRGENISSSEDLEA